jgi:cysteine desulfurase family protein
MAREHQFIYADNAATTFPKPHPVLARMLEVYEAMGVSPGRGSFDLSIAAEALVDGVRRRVAAFFGSDDPLRVAFGYNAPDALNSIILGMAEPGCHVVSSRLEHNSVLRPLHHLATRGTLARDLVRCDARGFIDPDDVGRAITPKTRFVILTHGSNVLGTVQPVERIAAICGAKGVPLILDVTQTAGIVPVRMGEWDIGGVAFTGHKSLYGPTGIGGLVLKRGLDVRTTRFGGTGMDSRSLVHSQGYPRRLEAGTLNMLGIIGLSEGISFVEEQGLQRLHDREMLLIDRLRDGLSSIQGVRLYGTGSSERRLPILLCNVEGMEPDQVSTILDGDFGIATRAGLHCAPLAHETLGTSPRGAVRFSLGAFNTEEEIERMVEAVAAIARFRATGG